MDGMKKFGSLLLAAIAATGLASCSDSDVDQANNMSYVTVHETWVPGDYYFETDAGKTIYAGDKTRVSGYKAKEGQRALIAFNFLETKVAPYDYNAAIYAIGNFDSAPVRVVEDEAELAGLKDDPIIEPAGRLMGNWITLVIRHRANTSDTAKHKFAMIVNKAEPATTEEGYLDLELRHENLEETTQGYYYDRYYSFNVEDIADLLDGKQGVIVRYKDGSEQTKSLKLKVEAAEGQQLSL